MWRPIENDQVVKLGHLQRLRNRTKGFNGNVGFDTAALPPLFPISTRALRYIEIGDFDLPARCRVLPRYEARERTLTYTTFLGDQANESRHPIHLRTTLCVLAH